MDGNNPGEHAEAQRVIAIDPGTAKCGVACLTIHGALVASEIVTPETLVSWVRSMMTGHEARVIVGDGTGHRAVGSLLTEAGIRFELVNERHTSETARRRLLAAERPRGLRRLIPRGLRAPHRPYDDWVAVVLAERAILRDDS